MKKRIVVFMLLVCVLQVIACSPDAEPVSKSSIEKAHEELMSFEQQTSIQSQSGQKTSEIHSHLNMIYTNDDKGEKRPAKLLLETKKGAELVYGQYFNGQELYTFEQTFWINRMYKTITFSESPIHLLEMFLKHYDQFERKEQPDEVIFTYQGKDAALFTDIMSTYGYTLTKVNNEDVDLDFKLIFSKKSQLQAFTLRFEGEREDKLQTSIVFTSTLNKHNELTSVDEPSPFPKQ